MRIRLILPLAGLLCLACSTPGPSLNELHRRLGNTPIWLSPLKIEELRHLRPQATGPLRLAIAPPVRRGKRSAPGWMFLAPAFPSGTNERPEFGTWTAEEASVIEGWRAQLVAEGRIAGADFLPSFFVGDPGSESDPVRSLREAAARQRADAVLIVETASGYEARSSVLSLLDLSLVGAYVLPAHRIYARTVMQAVVLDVQNEYVYATGRGDAERSKRAAAAYAEQTHRKLRQRTRGEALHELGQNLLANLEG